VQKDDVTENGTVKWSLENGALICPTCDINGPKADQNDKIISTTTDLEEEATNDSEEFCSRQSFSSSEDEGNHCCGCGKVYTV
jgi:hypothetical protein